MLASAAVVVAVASRKKVSQFSLPLERKVEENRGSRPQGGVMREIKVDLTHGGVMLRRLAARLNPPNRPDSKNPTPERNVPLPSSDE